MRDLIKGSRAIQLWSSDKVEYYDSALVDIEKQKKALTTNDKERRKLLNKSHTHLSHLTSEDVWREMHSTGHQTTPFEV
jgi:rRNA-processing protein FCF1